MGSQRSRRSSRQVRGRRRRGNHRRQLGVRCVGLNGVAGRHWKAGGRGDSAGTAQLRASAQSRHWAALGLGHLMRLMVQLAGSMHWLVTSMWLEVISRNRVSATLDGREIDQQTRTNWSFYKNTGPTAWTWGIKESRFQSSMKKWFSRRAPCPFVPKQTGKSQLILNEDEKQN